MIFSSLPNEYSDGGKVYRPFSSTRCWSCLIPRSCMSSRALSLSLHFPSMSSNVPIMLSQIFFSMCITSKLCLTSNFFSSKAAQKIYSSFSSCATYSLLHVASSFLWLSQILVAQNFHIVVKLVDQSMAQVPPSSLPCCWSFFLFLWHLWFWGRNRRWPK